VNAPRRSRNQPGGVICIEIGGVKVGLGGIPSGLAARVRRRYAQFLARGAPDLTVDLTCSRDGTHRPTEMPTVERTGERAYSIQYGTLAAELDLAAGRGRAEIPSSIWLVDSLLRMTFGLALLERGGLLLHSSGVLCGRRALVCFGPSGVGKTTVTRSVPREDVMCDEMIALVPNGAGVRAYGTPFHGDYRICAPRTAPLGALVRLVQGATDELTALSPAVAAQTLLNSMLFFCRDDHVAEAALSAAIAVCTAGAFRLTFQKGTHVPNYIRAKLGWRAAAGAVAQAAGPRAER
jgi:hypothetical protein